MTTMLARVTRGTVLSACAAAAFAAATTGFFAAWLVQRAEDRRLRDAGVVLADELDADAHASAQAAVDDELRETSHMGLLFAVFDRDARVAGDARLTDAGDGNCVDLHGLRACTTATKRGLHVVTAGAHASIGGWLLVSALVSMLLSALVALLASRPLAATLVGPLTRLRERLARLDVAATIDLGDPEHVEEVDRLRETLGTLLTRLASALAQAERFSANAAHELRTPLTAMRAQLELAHEDPARAPATLAAVQKTASRLEVLVERLLVLATPHDAPEPALETLSMRDALEDVVATLPDQQRIALVFTDDVSVRADAALVHAMLSNALSNALRFGTRVTATLARDGAHARVVIDDDGPGVAADERERVFEPFQRLKPGGHGLGLALIAHVARRYGGGARFLPTDSGARLELTLRSAA